MTFRVMLQHLLLPRYLLRALVGPFLFSFFTLMFLFLLHFIMRFIDHLVGKGLTAWVIIELIGLNLAWMVVLAVPMSVLVSTLMAFGELSSSNEITAMRASGMSTYRMIAPVLVTASVIAFLLVLFNNHVLPEANHKAKSLGIDIRRKKPTLNLVAGLFSQDISGYSILVRKTFEETNDLEGVTLYDYTNPNTNVVVTAKRGTISFSGDYKKLIMDLYEGEIHELELQKMTAYRRVQFLSHRIVMDVEGFDFERSAEGAFTRGDRELSVDAMERIVDSLQRAKQKLEEQLRNTLTEDMERQLSGKTDAALSNQRRLPMGRQINNVLTKARVMSSMVETELSRIQWVEKQVDQYMVEIHKKYSIPVAALVFVLIGVPLGIMVRRGGFGMAATLSLGFFVLYWAFLIGGEKLADRNIASPFWGMWSANFLLSLLGIYLIIRIGRETIVINWSSLQRLVPKHWRTQLQDEQQSDLTRV